MKNKKKIIYLRTDLLPENTIAGGSISHTVGVLQGLDQLGYEIICASAILKIFLERLTLQKLYILSNPHLVKKLPSKINNLVSNIFFTNQVISALKYESVSFIYQRYNLLNATGVLVKKIKKLPLVLEYNGSEVWVDQHWSAQRLIHLRFLIRFFEWLNLRYADYIVVVSQALHDDLVTRGIPSKKILVNPNGVNTDLYNPEKLYGERKRIRQNLSITKKFVFGFVGTFSPWHGIEMLEKVIPQVVTKNSIVHFLLIGDGPLRKQLEMVLLQSDIGNEHVTFTGLVSHEKARSYLAACDAYLSPTQPNPDGSRFFGSPTKLFEYLSMGRPVIASDLEQVQEVISPSFSVNDAMKVVHNQVGVIIEPTNTEDWVDALCKITNISQESLQKLGYNARSKAITHYQWQHHVQRIINFIKN